MMSQPVLRITDRLATALALLAGFAVAILAVLIVIDIVARSFFRVSLQGTDELGGYTLALIGSLGLSYTLLKRGHPRIDLGLRLFPLRVRAALHVAAYAGLTAFAAFMAWRSVAEFRQTLAYQSVANTPLQTPLWMPQSLWVAGTCFFAFTAMICTVDAARRGLADPAAADRLYGPPSVKEEVETYTGELPAATNRPDD